jgi:hypothetical protein
MPKGVRGETMPDYPVQLAKVMTRLRQAGDVSRATAQ